MAVLFSWSSVPFFCLYAQSFAGLNPTIVNPGCFGFSLGSSYTCINLPRKGDMVLKIMSGLSQTRTGTAGRSGLCLRTKFGGDTLEGVADGIDGMVVSVRVAADPLAGAGLFILIGAELFIRFGRAVFIDDDGR